MNRLGFRHDNLRRTLPELLGSANLSLDAVYTHFASADVPDSPVFDEQRVRFEQALATVESSWAANAADCATRPTARRCCGTRASGTTSCARACCSTASSRRRSRRRFR